MRQSQSGPGPRIAIGLPGRHARFARSGWSPAAALAVLALGLGCGETGPSDAVGRIEVQPGALVIVAGEDTALTARVLSADGTPLTDRSVFWASADPLIATVSSRGEVTGIAPGSTRLAASSGGRSAVVQVRVLAPPVVFVRVTPTTSGVGVGAVLTLRAQALDASGDTVVGPGAQWRSSATTVATVSPAGAVQGVAPGTVNITATIGGVTGAAVIAVQPKAVAVVQLAPATASVFTSQSIQLTATLKASDSTVLTGRHVTWSSAAPAVATVSSTGLVTGLAPGSTTITAASEGRSANMTITVAAVPVAQVSVIPASVTVATGRSAPLAAIPLDSTGAVLGGRVMTWSSAAPAIATVSASGVVTGVAPGTARITASTGGRSGSSLVTVTPIPVERISIAPATATVLTAQTLQLTATLRDAAGNVLTGRSVTWTSGSQTIARVSSTGLVTAASRGTVLIFAESEGRRAQATITVP